jgi:hypothetical protein
MGSNLLSRVRWLGLEPDLFLAGDTGEGLGERFSLSADGSRIAVRRESNNPDSVEVYIGAGGEATATQVGETVSVRTGTL